VESFDLEFGVLGHLKQSLGETKQMDLDDQ
jgi:hypothetical protein